MAIEYPQHLLPNPTQNYGSETQGNILVNEFEVVNRQRPAFAHDMTGISVSWSLSQLDRGILKSFIRDMLNHGSAPFNVNLMGVDGLERFENVIIKEGSYTEKYVPHLHWSITASLVAIDAPGAPAGIVEFMVVTTDMTPGDMVYTFDLLYEYLMQTYGESGLTPEMLEFIENHS